MLPEERQMLADLFDRVKGQANNPRDRDAETFIADAVRAQPYAPYLLSQTVLVQEQALRAADQKLQELQAQVQELTAELDDMHAQAQRPASSGSFLGGLFGGGAAPARPAPQPQRSSGNFGSAPQQQYAPQQGGPWGQPQQPQQAQPSPWGAPQAQPQGGGFLKGALGAAAGVAGGVLLADSIRGLMGGHGGFGGGMGGIGAPGGGTTINNFYDDRPNDQTAADAQQDADQDQDDMQDADDDYGDGGGDDDYSGDA